jgi:hypothetical protein
VTKETFTSKLDRVRLKEAELCNGHHLRRTSLVAVDPAVLWDHRIVALPERPLETLPGIARSFKGGTSTRN